jgi:filamentous hemagglutinin family protein
LNLSTYSPHHPGFRFWFSLWKLGGLFVLGSSALVANPTGGAVASGSASIAGEGSSAVTITQKSNTAIINWQSFSIGAGELTKFVQPDSTSATLNRVLGGQTSILNGTLSANGQIYLINGNGILVGPTGVIRTTGFTASTRDITDGDFLSGNLHFVGAGNAGVENLGTIDSLGGNVYLIGKTVDNEGSISAAQGTAGLIAGNDVLLAQQNGDGSTVTVQPVSGTSPASTGVSNSGTIRATRAELKAAGGNVYALAINNSGVIRASTIKRQGGHIYLTADGGTIVNSGTLDASAVANNGTGGTIAVKNMGGTTAVGGNAEVSGETVQFTGTVDLSAKGGTTGTLLFDPEDVTIQTAGSSTTTASGTPTSTFTGDAADSILTVADLEAALANANITVITGTGGSEPGNISVANPVTWSSGNSLTLSAYANINLAAGLTSSGGGAVTLQADNTGTGTGTVAFTNGATVSTTGAVTIFYNPADNPAGSSVNTTSYTAPTDYSADVVGGTLTAYMLVNSVSDLQDMQNNLVGTYALGRDIDASVTASWNYGQGFIPVGSYDYSNSNDANAFQGSLNGQNFTISDLYVTPTSSNDSGLFGDTGSSSTLENIGLTNVHVSGSTYVGGLVGVNNATIVNDTVGGTVTGTTYVGGLLGINAGAVSRSSSSATVTGGNDSSDIGGLVGFVQYGTISDSYSTGAVTAGSSSDQIGGLVGVNYATIHNTYSAGTLTAGTGSSELGGLAGANGGTINNSFWDTDTAGSQVVSGVGSDTTPNTTAGVTAATSADLGSESFILANSPTAPTWDFTPVTGTWAIDSSVNGGLPYLQAAAGSAGTSSPTSPTSPSAPTGTALSTRQGAAFDQVEAAQNEYSRWISQERLTLVDQRATVASFTGDGINTGDGVNGNPDDLSRGSFQGQMVTPFNGFFRIVPGAVVTVPPAFFREFEELLNPQSQRRLHEAAFGTH